MTTIVAIPVKPFDAAKQRLSDRLTPDQRRRLSIELASRTASAAADGGATPLILSADDEVTDWATAEGHAVLLDEGSSLNRAAASAVEFADQSPWIICHADLPLITATDIAAASAGMEMSGWVISPSTDGGTSLLGGTGAFSFAYGKGSFHSHLARLASTPPLILTRIGTMLDLDTESDLVAAIGQPQGGWLNDLIR